MRIQELAALMRDMNPNDEDVEQAARQLDALAVGRELHKRRARWYENVFTDEQPLEEVTTEVLADEGGAL